MVAAVHQSMDVRNSAVQMTSGVVDQRVNALAGEVHEVHGQVFEAMCL